MNWFKDAFSGFLEISPVALIIAAAAAAIGAAGMFWWVKRRRGDVKKYQWTTHELTSAALCIAASFLLSFIKIFSLPNGGSITPASALPVMAFAYIYGVRRGAVAGLLFGLLQFIQEPIFLGFPQFLLDYVCAFTLLCLCGLSKKSVIPGIIYGYLGMFVSQFLSGVLFFGEYAPPGVPAWLYSLGYNGSICGVNCAICIAVCLIPALNAAFKRAKLKADGTRAELAHTNV